MTSRQRGATWLLALILAGRLLDGLDLPFENHTARQRHLHADRRGDSLRAVTTSGRRDTSAAVSAVTAPPPDPAADSVRVDINRANVRELQTLPRVGPVLAARIVAWRRANGPFRSHDDLTQVPGIGARTAAQLAPRVRFGQEP